MAMSSLPVIFRFAASPSTRRTVIPAASAIPGIVVCAFARSTAMGGQNRRKMKALRRLRAWSRRPGLPCATTWAGRIGPLQRVRDRQRRQDRLFLSARAADHPIDKAGRKQTA